MPHDQTRAVWRKSSRSHQQGECVEVTGNFPDVVAMRDSKDPNGPKLMLDRSSFRRLVGEIRSGGHNL